MNKITFIYNIFWNNVKDLILNFGQIIASLLNKSTDFWYPKPLKDSVLVLDSNVCSNVISSYR